MDKKINKIMDVKFGDEVRKVVVKHPTSKVNLEANKVYSKAFSQLIKEKGPDGKAAYILRAQLNSYLADIGIYSNQDIEDIQTFSDRIKELETILQTGGKKKSEGRAAAIELRKYRYAIFTLLMKQSEYDKNTVEHYADNARMDYLITKCICFEDGSPIFKTMEDYETDTEVQRSLREPIQYLAGIVSDYDPNFEKKLPENQFLIKYNFCDENYRLINKDGQFVDENNNLIDDSGNLIVETTEAKPVVGEFLDDESDN